MEEKIDKEIEKMISKKKIEYKKINMFIVIEVLILIFNIDRCACGIPFHNTIISKVVILIQILVDFIFNKAIINESKRKTLLLIINIVLFIIFLIGLRLIQNDMDKLHSI